MQENRVYQYFFTVRGYEIDSFQHVNNAVYIHYLEQARWELLKETETLPYLEANRIIPAVIETHIRYIREAKRFDELVVKSSIVMEAPYVVFYQDIYHVLTQKKCCKAYVKHLFLDENRTPCGVSDFLMEKWGIENR